MMAINVLLSMHMLKGCNLFVTKKILANGKKSDGRAPDGAYSSGTIPFRHTKKMCT